MSLNTPLPLLYMAVSSETTWGLLRLLVVYCRGRTAKCLRQEQGGNCDAPDGCLSEGWSRYQWSCTVPGLDLWPNTSLPHYQMFKELVLVLGMLNLLVRCRVLKQIGTDWTLKKAANLSWSHVKLVGVFGWACKHSWSSDLAFSWLVDNLAIMTV